MSDRVKERVERGTAAALRTAASLGLPAERADVLQDSNRVVVRVVPCDTVARVVESSGAGHLEPEIALADRLAHMGAPVAVPEPRVERRVHGEREFAMTFWRHYEPVEPREIEPVRYGTALKSLHESMSTLDTAAPHFTERAAKAEGLALDPEQTPALEADDRAFLVSELRRTTDSVASSGAPEQLLHGEPHSDNVLRTAEGLLFIDFEASCRGPVEFDVADVPEAVAGHYPGVNLLLLEQCRRLVLAMVSTWCWAGFDDHENLRRAAPQLLSELRVIAAHRDVTG
ncbi:MAG TPA: phosphotransferase [Acidimicrobiales bacterium]|nr:phosphotransferase [Acidimicrobiales bacterium]